MIWSPCSLVRSRLSKLMSWHSMKISLKSSAFRSCATSLIHCPSIIASRTDRFFIRLCWNSNGKSDAGDRPSIQLDDQKDAFLPSCTVTLVAAVNKATSVSSTGIFSLSHGFGVSHQASHNHRSRKALLNLSRSNIPSPPPLELV